MGISVEMLLLSCMYRSLYRYPCTNVDTCISGLTAAILNFWVISACVTIDKDLLEFTQQKNKHTTLFIQLYHVYQGCLLRATILLMISPIKVANMTSCLLRSRDVKIMKSMLSCREFICAQSHKFLSYLIRQKVTQQRVLWGYFSPICNIRVNNNLRSKQ